MNSEKMRWHELPERCLMAVFMLLTVMLPARLQAADDDVVISKATDEYRVDMRDGKFVVVNSAETEYQLNSTIAQTIQPDVFYGDFITLNRADCSRSTASYKTATPENIFYDDTKVCFFSTTLDRKHPKATLSYTRTFTDAHYWARVYFADSYRIRDKQVTVILPRQCSQWRIIPMNCGSNVQLTKRASGSDSVFTFSIHDIPAIPDDDRQPPLSATQPHFIIVGPFANVDALYRWTQQMQQVDCSLPQQDALIASITKGCRTDEEKVSATYNYVQRNIRYVAYEAGIAGHRPDRPSEVLRKGYGDCKGMALLLRTLLRAEGYDARLADIGTRDITIRMGDYPCLAASNHVICVMRLKGKTYWLDATMEYTPYNYIPQHIQGQQALVENGDKYTLETVPVLPATTSVDHLSYDYRIGADDLLTGKANYRLSGDMKEYFFSLYGHRKNKDQEGFLADNLNNDDHSNTVTHVTFAGEQPQSEWATFSGDVTNSHALQRLDGELYLEMDPHNNYFTMRIDTTERRQDFMLPVCCNIEREVTVTLPAGARVTFLPQPFIVRLPQGTLSCTFRQSGGKVVFVQQMRISNRRIPLATIPDWNKSLDQWTDACNQQVIIHL